MRTECKSPAGLDFEATFRVQGKHLLWLVKHRTDHGDVVKASGFAETDQRAKQLVHRIVEAMLRHSEPEDGYTPEPTWTSNPFRGYEFSVSPKGNGLNWALRQVDLQDEAENPVRANGFADTVDEAEMASWAIVKELVFGEVEPPDNPT